MCLDMSSMTRAVACKRISLERKEIDCFASVSITTFIEFGTVSEMILLSQLEPKLLFLMVTQAYCVTVLTHCSDVWIVLVIYHCAGVKMKVMIQT